MTAGPGGVDPRWEADLGELARWAGARAGHRDVDTWCRRLYDECYSSEPPWRRTNGPTGRPGRDLGAELASADLRSDGSSDGWIVEETGAAGTVVRRGSSRTVASPGRYVADPVGVTPKAGTRLSLVLAKGSRFEQPGYYVAFGTVVPLPVGEPVVRIYWRVRAAGAAGLLQVLTTGLDAAGIPFIGKWMIDANDYARTDPVVLYLRRADLWRSRGALGSARRVVQDWLVDPPPLFTRRIGAGVGLAEDPSNGASFGESRCRAVAAGLLEAERIGADGALDRIKLIRSALEAAGISPTRPYRALCHA